jgi:hypothetical protein
VPEPAQAAVLSKPRRLGDDLMFRTKREHQFRQESWSRTWEKVRDAFVMGLDDGHHLRRRLAEDPHDRFDFVRTAALRCELHAEHLGLGAVGDR